nr:dCTP pyrophosphatase 1-like [Ipomoea trifida]
MSGEEGSVSLDLLKKKMNDFAKERDWEKFHSPRNLLLAMKQNPSLFCCSIIFFVRDEENLEEKPFANDPVVDSRPHGLVKSVGEVGELSEIFQWKGEVPKGLPGWEEAEKTHLGEELSDVLLYLVRLSDVCGIDLGKAALRKVELNALKYPANNTNSPCKSKNSKDGVKMSN